MPLAETSDTLRRLVARARPALVFFAIYAITLGRALATIRRDGGADGDGFYIYLFARSLAFDGDLSLANDYALCGDPWSVGDNFGEARAVNPWYIGPSLLFTPVLFLLRMLGVAAGDADAAVRAGCHGPLVATLGCVVGPLLVTATVALAYRIARRFVGETWALVACVVVALGSGLQAYGTVFWHYAHASGAFAWALAALALLRAAEDDSRLGRWLAVGAAAGLATLMRPHHAVFMLAPGLLTALVIAREVRAGRAPGRAIGGGLACLAAFVAVAALRVYTQRLMYGEHAAAATSSLYLQFAHAHPFLLLFSGRSGWLVHHPLMWLSLLGLVPLARSRATHPAVGPWLLAFALDFYVCASPLDWTGGWSVGPRLLVSFSALFVVTCAMTLESVERAVTASPARLRALAATGWLAPLVVLSLFHAETRGPYDAPTLYPRQLQQALRSANEWVGNPAAFPAPLVFAARYRAPPSTFDRLADYGLFLHDFGDGRYLGGDSIRFAHTPKVVSLLEGWTPTDRGARLTAGVPARLLVTSSWPYIDGIELTRTTVDGAPPCSVRVRVSGFFLGRELGRRSFREGEEQVRWSGALGAFDSGINEITVRSSCDIELATLRFLDRAR